jgi:hypothetical protein
VAALSLEKLTDVRMLVPGARRRILLLGSDLSVFFSFWRHHADASDEISAFIDCNSDPPPIRFFRATSRQPLKVYPLGKLEKVVMTGRIQQCTLMLQNSAMDKLQSIVNRIIAIGTCQLHILPHDVAKIDSCKPVIGITSRAPGVGKTRLTRHIARVFAQNQRKVAVIIPMNDCPTAELFEIGDTFVAEVKSAGAIPDGFGPQSRSEIEAFQAAGASAVFVGSDTRQAIIRAEQCSDVILYDAKACEVPLVVCKATLCVANASQASLWPGPVNFFGSDSLVLFGEPNAGLGSPKRVFFLSESDSEVVQEPPGFTVGDRDAIIVRSERSQLQHEFKSDLIDHDFDLYKFLVEKFIQHRKPALQFHFESQVDVIRSLSTASDTVLYQSHLDSSNRESFCRLFLASHLPPTFRVTTGEILDSQSNTTGQLDVVIVNAISPRMAIHTSIIGPIMADTVLCVVEVKTTITTESLAKALSQLRPVKALMTTHSTLELTNGDVVEDPLGGKILTGVFAFDIIESAQPEIPKILERFRYVADFVVVPGILGYFSTDLLAVCGLDLQNAAVFGNLMKVSAKGMELGMLFGVLNGIAAVRRFSGASSIRYLNGSWGGRYEAMTRCQQDAERSLGKVKKLIGQTATAEQKREVFRTHDHLFHVIGEVRSRLIPPG